jgi:hypothetical protein
MSCQDIDFLYPMYADLYLPIIGQSPSGKIQKTWAYDRTITCNATPVGGAGSEEIKPEVFVQYEGKLIARSKKDIRFDNFEVPIAATNILITNIRNCSGEILYKETSGPRSELGTIYEIGTIEPFVNPFGSVEYYKMLWRKTDNQIIVESQES